MDHSDKIVISKLKKIAVISLVFMTIEIIGGALAHSIAIMADAFHLLSDVIAYAISLYAVLLSKRMAPKYLTFGYEKAQPLGALINVGIIWFVTIYLFIEATNRIIQKQVVKQPLFMLLTSIFGLACNLVIMKILHAEEGGHCHSHGHSHTQPHNHHHDQDKKNRSHPRKNSIGHQELQNNQFNEHSCGSQRQKQVIEISCSCEYSQQKPPLTIIADSVRQNLNTEQLNTKQLNQPFPIHATNGLIIKKNGYCAIHFNSKHPDHRTHQHTGESCQDHDSGHDHYHSHQDYEDEIENQSSSDSSKTFQNINLQAAYIHIISDIILSVGVIVSAIIIYFTTENNGKWTFWQLADPFCTYFFSIMALYSTITIVKQSVIILMDGCQNTELFASTEKFIKILKSHYSNIEVEDFKIWSSNRGKHYFIIKLMIGKSASQREELELSGDKIQLKRNDNLHAIYQKIEGFCKSKKIAYFVDVKYI